MKNSGSDTSIVITGKKRGGPRQLADYLMNMGENEYVRVCEIGCFVAKTIPDALAEMWAVADGSKAKDFIYHVTVNPRPGVTFTDEQWKESIDTLEKKLGFVGHQRVVVEHIKKGRTHRHVAWNRADPKTGLVKKLSFDRHKLRATALELGNKFGLTPTPNVGQSYKRGETERGKRTGLDPKIVKAEVTALWNSSKSGHEFVKSLAKRGYILAKGDKSQFVLIDKAGSVHGLTRRIDSATAKTVRRGMADIDVKTLPTITEVRSRIKATDPHYTPKRKTTKSKDKSGAAARTYIRRGKGGSTTSRRGRTKANRWRPYSYFLSSRRFTAATAKAKLLGSAAQKNLTASGAAKPNLLTSNSSKSTAAKSSTATNNKGQIPDNTTRDNANIQKPSSGTNPNLESSNQTNATPQHSDVPHDAGSNSGTGGSSPLAHLPITQPFRPFWNGDKEEKNAQQDTFMPALPDEDGSMCLAQRLDLRALRAGRITRAQYNEKWGRGGGPKL